MLKTYGGISFKPPHSISLPPSLDLYHNTKRISPNFKCPHFLSDSKLFKSIKFKIFSETQGNLLTAISCNYILPTQNGTWYLLPYKKARIWVTVWKYWTKIRLESIRSKLKSMSDVRERRMLHSSVFGSCNILMSLGLVLYSLCSAPWQVSHISGMLNILRSLAYTIGFTFIASINDLSDCWGKRKLSTLLRKWWTLNSMARHAQGYNSGMGITDYSLITCKVHLNGRNMSSTINDWGLKGPKGAPFTNGHGIKLPLNLYFCSHRLM